MTARYVKRWSFVLLLLSCCALLGACAGAAWPAGLFWPPEPTRTNISAPETTAPVEALPSPEAPDVVTDAPRDTDEPGPGQSATPTAPTGTATRPPASSTPPEATLGTVAGLPEADPVTNDFFSDAAIVGNSLIEGLRLFSDLQTCDYYAATSMSVLAVDSLHVIQLENGSKGTIMQGIAQKPYGKVYILLGINEIGVDVGYFKDAYATMLDGVRQSQPDADIYIMSLTPVSQYKSSTSDVFNMTRVEAFNKALYELSLEKGSYYIDLCDALAGEDGYLPAESTSDGVHFSASLYTVWANYLRSHHSGSGAPAGVVIDAEEPVELPGEEGSVPAASEPVAPDPQG